MPGHPQTASSQHVQLNMQIFISIVINILGNNLKTIAETKGKLSILRISYSFEDNKNVLTLKTSRPPLRKMKLTDF